MRRKMIVKRVLTGVLALSMIVQLFNGMVLNVPASEISNGNTQVSQNDNNSSVVQKTKQTKSSDKYKDVATGYIDAGIDYGRISDEKVFDTGGLNKTNVIPESYSSVEKGYVTSIKNQNPWGTCWAFAAVAAMESYALSHGLVERPEDINLSEFALAYLSFNDEKMVYDSTADYSYIDDMATAFDSGGNDEIAFKALSNGLAVYDDDEVQYAETISGTVPEIEWDESNISYVLTGQKYIDMADMSQVKAAVMENGAVTTAYYSSYAYTNQTYGLYLYNYNYENESTNHAVVIVGWDDNIDKNLFTVTDGTNTYVPENNGAWLIKNSWGTYFGNQGYIWISYEDLGILSSDAVVYEIAPKEDYPVLYQHDGATVAYGTTYGERFASVFDVVGESQIINAVSFFTGSYDTECTVYLYDNSDGSSLDNGELIDSADCTITYAGYYTIDLDNDYAFVEGDKYSIIVAFNDVSYVLYATTSQNIAYTGMAYSDCESGQNYIERFSGYGFSDVVDLGSYKNISLKAHAKYADSSSVSAKISSTKVLGKDSVSISWREVEGAVSYELWKSTTETGEDYKVVSGITGTSYVDSSISSSDASVDKVEAGKTYYYMVRPIFSGGNAGGYSNCRSVEIVPEATVVTVDVVNRKLNIEWQKVADADGYDIFIGEDYTSSITYVDTVASDKTSYIYQKDIYAYITYFVVVKPYFMDSLGEKHYAGYEICHKELTVGTVNLVESNYFIEDVIYLNWEWIDYDIVDGLELDVYCSGYADKFIEIDMTNNTYYLDISEYNPGDELEISMWTYTYDEDGFIFYEYCYDFTIQVAETFNEEVYWYVQDNSVFLKMPYTAYNEYNIYYNYDETRTCFDNYITVSDEDLLTGCSIPIGTACDEQVKISVVASFEYQVSPKDVLLVGGNFEEVILEPISDTTCSFGEGVLLGANITNKMKNFYYTYQWYEADSKDGTAVAISDANYPEYTAYVLSTEVKYYYCQVTCWYNGEKVYTTDNGNGSRTKIIGSSYYENIIIDDISSQTYTGSVIKPTVTIKHWDKPLTLGVDYTVSYSNNINAGIATVQITYIGEYSVCGTQIKNFTIVAKSISNVSVTGISNSQYTGSAITPIPVVKDGTKTLVKGTDYTVTYSNNINAGTATVKITGIGNYTGTKTVTFTITATIVPDEPEEPVIPSVFTSVKWTVNNAKNYISKISIGTTVNALINSINEKEYAAVYKGTTKLAGTSAIGTGMYACIMNGSAIIRKYTLIVTGDTNGDGKINITDMIAVKAHILKKTLLTGVYQSAGDVNGDGKINITDFIKIKATLLKKDTITGVTAK